MKKIKLSIMLMLVILVSCKKGVNYSVEDSNIEKVSNTNSGEIDSDNADAVNLLKLETECDCIDAGIIVAKELVSFDNEKITSVQQDRVNELEIKLNKIEKLMRELGTEQGTLPYENGVRIKWSYFSCENFKEYDRITPHITAVFEPGMPADTSAPVMVR